MSAPFTPEQEMRLREIVREEAIIAAMVGMRSGKSGSIFYSEVLSRLGLGSNVADAAAIVDEVERERVRDISAAIDLIADAHGNTFTGSKWTEGWLTEASVGVRELD